jgi:uncharacterized membrane protein YphA (DoxX/SURF4 family)
MNSMKLNGLLHRVNRISAWVLFVLMIAYIVTGYAWSKGIIMSRSDAIFWHTSLDLLLVFVFLVHILIGAKLALRRYGVDHPLVNPALLVIGLAGFISALMIS